METTVSKTEEIQKKLDAALVEIEDLRRQNESLKDDLLAKETDLRNAREDLLAKETALRNTKEDLLAKETDLRNVREDLLAKESDLRNAKEDLMATEANLKLTEEKLRRALKRMFGSSSEHIARDGDMYEQLSFVFNEPELIADTEPAETEVIEVKGHRRKRVKSGSIEDILPDDAPVEVIEYRPDDISCPECGNEMEEIGKEVRRTLVLVRKHYKVRDAYVALEWTIESEIMDHRVAVEWTTSSLQTGPPRRRN
ncbi:MAG: hypothetical protein J5744_06625 [Oscillospiraceae bacterium]|nr:hypothetical protein [Oscillospiraceae bacterium]